MRTATRLVVLNSKKYVLDLISVVTAAAYSLRRLYASYTGAAIKVQRSLDDAKADIGFTANGDLDTVALLAFVGSGNGFIITWYDQSGNGRHATQTTTGNQPQIVSNGAIETQNGKPALVVSGSQNMLSTLTVAQAVGSVGVQTTTSAVFQSQLNVHGSLVGNGDGNGAYNIYSPWFDNRTYFDVVNTISGRLSGSLTWDALSVGSFVRNDAFAGVYKNGVLKFSSNIMGATGALPSNNLTLFSRDKNANYMVGSASEMIFFPSALSTTDRQTLERNQGIYFNISVS